MTPNTPDTTSTIGSRFVEERQRLGLGVQQAAYACGITRNAINKIERRSMCSGAVLQKFALAGADVHYILTGKPQVLTTEIPLPRDVALTSLRHLRYARLRTRDMLASAKARDADEIAATFSADLDELDAAVATFEKLLNVTVGPLLAAEIAAAQCMAEGGAA